MALRQGPSRTSPDAPMAMARSLALCDSTPTPVLQLSTTKMFGHFRATCATVPSTGVSGI
jgi:hypothetical protein